jgi:hypothetical protein
MKSNLPVVVTLEDLAEGARSGDVVGLAAIAVMSNGDVRYVVQGASYEQPAITMELLHRLNARILQTIVTDEG